MAPASRRSCARWASSARGSPMPSPSPGRCSWWWRWTV